MADDVYRKPTGDEVDWEDRRSGGIEVTAGRMPALPGRCGALKRTGPRERSHLAGRARVADDVYRKPTGDEVHSEHRMSKEIRNTECPGKFGTPNVQGNRRLAGRMPALPGNAATLGGAE